MAQLQIGDRAFYDGRIFKVVGSMDNNWLLFNEEVSWSALVVRKHRVERVAEDVYQIGDQVSSFHMFTGEVTGFEPKTNRVVCKSNTARDRVRYAYKVDEIQSGLPQQHFFVGGYIK